jgi:hypothetical protein
MKTALTTDGGFSKYIVYLHQYCRLWACIALKKVMAGPVHSSHLQSIKDTQKDHYLTSRLTKRETEHTIQKKKSSNDHDIMFRSSNNKKKKSAFEAMLEQHGLSHCYTALKGSDGTVQLQHIMKLKKIAVQQGEEVLAKVLGEVSVVSAKYQKALAVLLCKQLKERGGLPTKPVEPAAVEGDTGAWRAGIGENEDGTLPSKVYEHSNIEEKNKIKKRSRHR